MCIPLTQAQKDQLLAEKQTSQNQIDKYDSIAPKRAEKLAEKQLIDDGFAAGFNYYDGIITSYEDEREELTGDYVEDPVVEADINNPASLLPSRTTPVNPVTDIIRISQFDGTPLINTANEIPGVQSDIGTTQLDIEPYWIAKQAEIEDWLVNGFGGTSPTITMTMTVTDAITPSTTQITIESSAMTETFNFQVGDTFVIYDGSTQVGVLVTNVVSQNNGDPDAGFCTGEDNPPQTDQTSCEADNGTWTSDPQAPGAVLDIIVLTNGSVGAGGDLDSSWAGYSNADRAAKIDSTDGYTAMLLDLEALLETNMNNRIAKLDAQETALQNNDDPDLDASALTDVQTSRTFLNNYLITTDLSNVGLDSLSSERATRSGQISTRITAINAAFTGQPSGNFYDLRYTSANDRGNTSSGTLRILRFEEATDAVIADIRAQLVDKIASIDSILASACP